MELSVVGKKFIGVGELDARSKGELLGLVGIPQVSWRLYAVEAQSSARVVVGVVISPALKGLEKETKLLSLGIDEFCGGSVFCNTTSGICPTGLNQEERFSFLPSSADPGLPRKLVSRKGCRSSKGLSDGSSGGGKMVTGASGENGSISDSGGDWSTSQKISFRSSGPTGSLSALSSMA